MEGSTVKHIGVAVGMNMIERIDQVRELADHYGFRLDKAPYNTYGVTDNIDNIALYPKDQSLPTYSRDACFFTGNLSELENFFEGIRWSRNYDQMIGAMSVQRREQYEAKEVARLTKIQYNKERAETYKTLKKEFT
jgi:hypothetical protein